MSTPTTKVKFVLSFLFAIFTLISCSKDSDLLAEYIISDSQNSQNEIREIKVLAVVNEPVIIDVLNQVENAIITGVTDPSTGTAIVNTDNTITYTPNTGAIGTDNFSYSTETYNEGASITASGNIEVTIVNRDVASWKEKFDLQFAAGDGIKMLEQSKSGNKFQEYYYMYYYFDGMLSIWQATGDNSYLDTMLLVINNTIEDASPVNFDASYLGWKADTSYGSDYDKDGVALWESYYWKAVTTLLRIMKKSPRLLTTAKYQVEFNKILSFTEQHIWDKWQAKGNSHIYRQNTHMASHWARMGMELYIITGKQKYKTVFDNISFGTMPGWESNLRSQIKPNPKISTAIVWSLAWGGSKIQDTSHASDLVSFWLLAYENGMYWTRADIDALVSTLDDVIFPIPDGANYSLNVDGSGGYDSPGRLRDWVKLGRYSKPLQNRLISQYFGDPTNASRYPIGNLGNFALNEKILADGKPVYPENP